MTAAFSYTQNTQATTVEFDYHDALQLDDVQRHVLKTATYATGLEYSLVMLVDGDETAAHHLSESIRAANPESLVKRSKDDYRRLLSYGHFNGSGGLMIGLVDHRNRLVGMGAIEAMDDESSHGSGPVVKHRGIKKNSDQVYWKTLGLAPEARGKGHLEELYEARMAITLQTGRPYAVLKTNNWPLIDNYTAVKKGWKNLSQTAHKGWSLDEDDADAGKNGKQVDVLVIDRNTALKWYEENKTGLVLPDLSIARYDGQKPTFH